MNQKELNELRRRFRPEKSSITHIYGCYVSQTGQIIAQLDESTALMPQEESALYHGFLKKVLSGTLGRNLRNISFSTAQVADSQEHRLLSRLRNSALGDAAARQTLYQTLIDAMDLEDTAYLILLAADSYDVPYRAKDNAEPEDAGDTVFRYFVCSVCPVKPLTPGLEYQSEEQGFHMGSSACKVSNPELGFLFPAFDSRTTNLYGALYYTRDPSQMHPTVTDAVFHTPAFLAADAQKNLFDSALCQALGQECSLDAVQAVHEQLREQILLHKESKSPEVLTLSVNQMGQLLSNTGISQERVTAFEQQCERELEEETVLLPTNLIDTKKFELVTPQVKISVDPEYSYLVQTRTLEGRQYLLIPADEGVEVNGIPLAAETGRSQ